jgi:hypothetical protein
VKNKSAPTRPLDYETLKQLTPVLAAEIGNAKLEAARIEAEELEAVRLEAPKMDGLDHVMGGEEDYECEMQEDSAYNYDDVDVDDGDYSLDGVLQKISNALAAADGTKLSEILQIAPPFHRKYDYLVDDVMDAYPLEVDKDWDQNDFLEDHIKAMVQETGRDDAGGWTTMVKFLAGWLAFLRDVDMENLLDFYEALSELFQKATAALAHPTKGVILLPTIVSYANTFAEAAIWLDKQPELIANLNLAVTEEGDQESLPEKAANIVRQAFVTCLSEKEKSIYGSKKDAAFELANTCLKILFQCDKKAAGEQIFSNIHNSAPPVALYPMGQRVTYLYYLGRFHFASKNYYAAQMALQEAYDHCPVANDFLKNRKLILIYLVASNVILGRFPSRFLYDRPEAAGFRERFEPLCRAIAKGDLEAFRRLTSPNSEHAPWFLRYRILFQIQNSCEVLVWRSLFRRVALLTGLGEEDYSTGRAIQLDLHQVLAAFRYLEKRALLPSHLVANDRGPGNRHFTHMHQEPKASEMVAPIHREFEGLGLKAREILPNMAKIEGYAASLVYQGFLGGFVSHLLKRFCITKANKMGGPLLAGFPPVWEVITRNVDKTCPGWRKPGEHTGGNPFMSGAALGGGVVNLSGARPAGMN